MGWVLCTFLLFSMLLPMLMFNAPTVSAYTTHATIYITSNNSFAIGENGVTSGSGIVSDPWIIENWSIDATSASGISIQNTTAYFVIRNCLVENGVGEDGYSGIYLENVINGRIENNICKNNLGIPDAVQQFPEDGEGRKVREGALGEDSERAVADSIRNRCRKNAVEFPLPFDEVRGEIQQGDVRNRLPELPQGYSHEARYLGERIEEDEILHCMWGDICSSSFEKTHDLQSRMLERIRETERLQALEKGIWTDRIKALGNAVVPDCAEFIGEMIMEFDKKSLDAVRGDG